MASIRCLPCPPKTITPAVGFAFPSGGTFFVIRRKQLCCELRSGAWCSGTSAENLIAAAAAIQIKAIRGQRCAQLPFRPAPPARRGSRKSRSEGFILVRTWSLGVCGTEREILKEREGFAPPGGSRLNPGRGTLG